MARKKKYENTSLEDILEILKSVKLPIFTLDRKWIVLFSGENRTKEMDKLEENVNKLLKSQGAVNSKKSELNQLKKRLMKGIVDNMESNDKRSDAKMAKSRELINDINDKLILLEDEELSLPRELREANAELGLEGLSVMYESINDFEEDIEELDEWIEKTRQELKEKVALRHEKAEINEKMRQYMYNIFGGEIVSMYRKYMEEEE
ncbi:MAG: hypothetical protein J6L69_07385 [Lachnospiraceae bacterium]|nr:hypothetical protein [Lachnospiraceae bacterium]